MPNSDLLQRKRDLRLRIGRMRRRINDRLHDAQREGRRLLSWRTYMVQYPIYTLLAAFGVGMAASGGFRRGRLLRRLGFRIVRQIAGQAGQQFWREIQRMWTESGVKP